MEVVCYRNDGRGWMSHYRQAQLDEARGEYFSCIDDDDLVVPDYVAVLAGIMRSERPDCIGFWTECASMNAHRVIQTVNNAYAPLGMLNYDGEPTLLRYINHITPVRTVIAREAGFPGVHWEDEDDAYSRALYPRLQGAREVLVPRCLYRYLWDEHDSMRVRGCVVERDPGPLPPVSSPCFRWHPQSV